jgi:uncharacterized protein with NAD-binding domain and iron-sulfur cluster
MYDPSARALNLLRLPKGLTDVAAVLRSDAIWYKGMTPSQRMRSALWLARMALTLSNSQPTPALDAYSFTAWCVAHGLDLDLTTTAWFRYVFDLTYNYPHEGSAYVGVQGFKDLLGYENSEVLYFNGGMSDVLIAPIAAHLRALGARVLFCEKAVRLVLDPARRRVAEVSTRAMARAVDVGSPDFVRPEVPHGEHYSLDDDPYPTGDPTPLACVSERTWRVGEDFDALVSTLPVDSLRALLCSTPDTRARALDHPTLAALSKLRSVASISLRLWMPDKVVQGGIDTVVLGLAQPTATLIDYAQRIDTLRTGGSVVELLGQEGLDASLHDDELAAKIITMFSELPFVDRARAEPKTILTRQKGITWQLRRNTAHHMRYALLEPGHWAHRPTNTIEGYDNLALAGDWVQSSQPTASTEAAVRSAIDAARVLRERVTTVSYTR